MKTALYVTIGGPSLEVSVSCNGWRAPLEVWGHYGHNEMPIRAKDWGFYDRSGLLNNVGAGSITRPATSRFGTFLAKIARPEKKLHLLVFSLGSFVIAALTLFLFVSINF